MSVGGRRIRPLFKRAMMLTATLLAATAGIMAAGTSRSLSRYSTLEVEVIGDSPNNAAKEGIDWPSLRKENPDVVGWLTVEGTSISYPVTSERGEHAGGWYLKHDFWGRASTLGCPYIDPRCTTEASHILIYGHTVDAPDSMFTPLSHAYEQQTFSLIGDAHWSTPEHGDATFKPLMAINVDALYPDIQQFRFASNSGLRSFLRSLSKDASCCAENKEELIERARRVLSLVTCPSPHEGECTGTIVIFVQLQARSRPLRTKHFQP